MIRNTDVTLTKHLPNQQNSDKSPFVQDSKSYVLALYFDDRKYKTLWSLKIRNTVYKNDLRRVIITDSKQFR